MLSLFVFVPKFRKSLSWHLSKFVRWAIFRLFGLLLFETKWWVLPEVFSSKNMYLLDFLHSSLISGVVVPCVLISTVMIGFGLSVLCVLSTSPYKVTETENDAKANDLELLDGTKSPKQMLFSLSFQFFMLSLCYISAGIQLVFPQYSTLLSVAVSISLISYGGYIMATFCIFRSDVCGIKTGHNQRWDIINYWIDYLYVARHKKFSLWQWTINGNKDFISTDFINKFSLS